MYKPKHFILEEFIPIEVYNAYLDRAWEFLDENLLVVADLLRRRYGKTIINDWKWGGDYHESGLRTPDCSHWRIHSQHSYGRAIDVKFDSVESEDVIEDIISQANHSRDYFKCMIGCIEVGTPTWVHVDVRLRRDGKILCVHP